MVMESKEGCIFCKIAKKEVEVDSLVYENDNFICFLDQNQKTPGHTLVVPKKHFVNVLDLPASLGQELLDAIKHVAEIRMKEGADGFNIIQNNGDAAGQVVMHAHFHVLPRTKGDGHSHYAI